MPGHKSLGIDAVRCYPVYRPGTELIHVTIPFGEYFRNLWAFSIW